MFKLRVEEDRHEGVGVMTKIARIIQRINSLSQNELDGLCRGLVWYDECTANRLKNGVAFFQQEHDLRFLDMADRMMKSQKLEDFDKVSSR